MAINKNFVIKNGVEVNTNLLVGDATLNNVGIATTVPGYDLHIGVGAGDRGGIGATDIVITGVATIGVANSTSGVLNVTGISTFLGDILIGSGSTVAANGNAAFAGIVTVGGDLNVTGDYTVDEITARNLNLTGIATIPTLGVTGIGTTVPEYTLHIGIGAGARGGIGVTDIHVSGIATIGVANSTSGCLLYTSPSPRD